MVVATGDDVTVGVATGGDVTVGVATGDDVTVAGPQPATRPATVTRDARSRTDQRRSRIVSASSQELTSPDGSASLSLTHGGTGGHTCHGPRDGPSDTIDR